MSNSEPSVRMLSPDGQRILPDQQEVTTHLRAALSDPGKPCTKFQVYPMKLLCKALNVGAEIVYVAVRASVAQILTGLDRCHAGHAGCPRRYVDQGSRLQEIHDAGCAPLAYLPNTTQYN